MKIIRKPKEGFIITGDKTLRDALVIITNNHKGTVAVVDDKGRFLGVVSDGDIRRAMLRGATEFTPVSKFENANSRFLGEDATDEEIIEEFKQYPGVNMLPLVTTENVVSQVAYVELSD